MSTSLQDIVERQVRRWRLESEARAAKPAPIDTGPPAKAIAIAHDHGSFGEAVAQAAGSLLEMPTFDRQVLQHIAHTAQVRLEVVETLDERTQSRLERYLGSLLNKQSLDPDEYFRHLSRAVMACWAHGPALFVGRGSVHIVPAEHMLRVRTVAPFDARVQRVVEAQGVSEKDARAVVAEVDGQRRAFHRRFFHIDVADPLGYDLVLNTAHLGVNTCARVIAAAYRHRFAASAASSPHPGADEPRPRTP